MKASATFINENREEALKGAFRKKTVLQAQQPSFIFRVWVGKLTHEARMPEVAFELAELT